MAFASVVAGAACSSPDPPAQACVENLTADCMPLYSPTSYDNFFQRTLREKCATGMGTCHTSDSAKGGLVFENADEAYALLLGQKGNRAEVKPGDPACSPLMLKLEAADPALRMPPGAGLIPAERCAVIKWIADGAKR